MNEIVKVQGLSKQFTELKAVDDLSFSVREGEVYGFLGQNGAGKSTTIRMLLSLVRPSSGNIMMFGKDLRHHRKQILRQVGAIIEKPDLYKYLSAIKNLEIMARLSGIRPTKKELMDQLEKVGIAERASSKVKTFSQGMKQRLGIACALIHNPRLIILDEPTNGLDPQGIADIRNLILQLSRREGKTVFVSSHLLSEIELIADSMLIVDRGKKIAEGSVTELLHPADTVVVVQTTDNGRALELLQNSQWGGFLKPGTELLLKVHLDKVPELVRFFVAQEISLISISPRHSLEAFFLSLTKPNNNVATYQD